VTTDRLTKMPDGCSMCADGSHAHHLHLHARCHMHAPMRLSYRRTGIDRGVVSVQCYIPHCAKPVATFGVREIIQPAAQVNHPGTITEHGVRWNLKVGIQYLESWLGGNGCVPLYNLMEDAATAEISRTQVWQWLHNAQPLDDGRTVTLALFRRVFDEELERIADEVGPQRYQSGKFQLAAKLFQEIIEQDELEEFLTLRAYQHLD